MITIQNIKDWSKPHSNKVVGARQTVIIDDKIILSIVGGASGLYGDFDEDFEVAVLDKEMKSFVTKFFRPEANDDVIPYMKGKELEEFVNMIFQRDFQVK